MKKILTTTIAIILTISPNTAFAKSNKEDVKQIKKTCSFLKSNYSISVFDSWRKGKSSDKDLINELDKNINVIKKEVNKNKYSMKTNLKNLLKSEDIIKNAIIEKNLDMVADGLLLNMSSFEKINVICLNIR